MLVAGVEFAVDWVGGGGGAIGATEGAETNAERGLFTSLSLRKIFSVRFIMLTFMDRSSRTVGKPSRTDIDCFVRSSCITSSRKGAYPAS